MNLGEYAQLDATGLAEQIRRRAISKREVIEVALRAHESVHAQLNAVVEVYDDALESTERSPAVVGPFEGVPFLIKDMGAHLAGRRIEAGSRLCRGIVPESDSYYVEAMREAGVIFFGRSNAPEFSIAATTEGLLHGNCSNPWRIGYSAGGSSGGACAAVAAGIVPMAQGSDIGGSMRIPASLCGVLGLKPSRGRVSCGPSAAEAPQGMAQTLVQTRSVRDMATALDAVSKPMPGDPFVIVQPGRCYADEVGAAVGRLRVAYSSNPLGPWPVHPETAEAVERTAAMLSDLGHEVVEAAPVYNPLEMMPHFAAVWFSGFAADLDRIANEQRRKIGPETLETATLAIYEMSKTMALDAPDRADVAMNAMRREFGGFFSNFDIWLTPATAQPAEAWGRYDQSQAGYSGLDYLMLTEQPIQFALPYNVSGLPAISLPLHETSDGLPIGIQLGARFGREDVLIRLASNLEEMLPWKNRLPRIHVSKGNSK